MDLITVSFGPVFYVTLAIIAVVVHIVLRYFMRDRFKKSRSSIIWVWIWTLVLTPLVFVMLFIVGVIVTAY